MKALKIIGTVIALMVVLTLYGEFLRKHPNPLMSTPAPAQAAVVPPAPAAAPAKRHTPTTGAIRLCLNMGDFVEAVMKHRNEGTSLADMHTVAETLEIPFERLRPTYQRLVDTAYTNPETDPAKAADTAANACLERMRNLSEE